MPSRYLIGIDLGTTNSVVAYIDTFIDTQEVADAASPIRVFPIPQLVAHGEVLTLPALPSFLYFPTEDELSAGSAYVFRSLLCRSLAKVGSCSSPPLPEGFNPFRDNLFFKSQGFAQLDAWKRGPPPACRMITNP